MPRFRSRDANGSHPQADDQGLSAAAIRCLVGDVLRPDNFFVGGGLVLEWKHDPEEELPWEIFRGRLLPRRRLGSERRSKPGAQFASTTESSPRRRSFP